MFRTQNDQKADTMGKADTTCTQGRITPDKLFGHLKTITEHKILVAKHCFAIGLYRQGIMHDLSKYMPSELINGFKYYQGGKRSPNNGERDVKGYSEAWMHHKGRNRHHYEYWTDYAQNPSASETLIVYVKMPRRYVAEMVMDRMAASKIYLKDKYTDRSPLEYLLRGRGRSIMHPETAMELEQLLTILAERGEKELFRFIRRYYLKGGEMKKAAKKTKR